MTDAEDRASGVRAVRDLAADLAAGVREGRRG
jgi:hypothetical protein